MVEHAQKAPTTVIGRYMLHGQIAFGGMATIHVGRLVGPIGFARTVAIKRLHGTFSANPSFVAMFMDEARIAARISHPNVVSIIDVVAENGVLLLVMDYVHGESLAELVSAAADRGSRADPHVVAKIMTEALSGLHAAHELKDEQGQSLGVVHRDVSPQNILVAADGVAHLIDFGIAKAFGRVQQTRQGQVKGKLRYMAPEQIECGAVDRRTDVFAAATVLWEALVGRYLFSGTEAQLLHSVLSAPIPPPTSLVPDLPRSLEAVVLKGLQRDPEQRFGSALEMADALEAAMRPATSRTVARWVKELAADSLEQRAKLIRAIEFEEHSLGHLSVHRGSGTIPSKLNGTDGAVEAVEPGESSQFDRHTMALPVQSTPPQATSAVHLRDHTTQRTRWRRRGWRAIAAFALAALGLALFAIAARVRSRDTEISARTRAQAAALAAPVPLARELGTSAPVVAGTDVPAPQASANPTPPTPSLAAPAALLPSESDAPMRGQSKPSEARASRVVSTKRAKSAAASTPATTPLNGPTHEPLYIRD